MFNLELHVVSAFEPTTQTNQFQIISYKAIPIIFYFSPLFSLLLKLSFWPCCVAEKTILFSFLSSFFTLPKNCYSIRGLTHTINLHAYKGCVTVFLALLFRRFFLFIFWYSLLLLSYISVYGYEYQCYSSKSNVCECIRIY